MKDYLSPIDTSIAVLSSAITHIIYINIYYNLYFFKWSSLSLQTLLQKAQKPINSSLFTKSMLLIGKHFAPILVLKQKLLFLRCNSPSLRSIFRGFKSIKMVKRLSKPIVTIGCNFERGARSQKMINSVRMPLLNALSKFHTPHLNFSMIRILLLPAVKLAQ